MHRHRFSFFFNDTATTEIYTLSLHDASSDLWLTAERLIAVSQFAADGLSPRLSARTSVVHDGIDLARFQSAGRSEEHTSELQSHSDLVCRLLLEKKKNKILVHTITVSQFASL